MHSSASSLMLAVQGILPEGAQSPVHGLPFANAHLEPQQPPTLNGRKENSLTLQKEETTFKECSQCRQQVVISYACPKCGLRVCMLCAIKSKWKCPECGVDVL